MKNSNESSYNSQSATRMLNLTSFPPVVEWKNSRKIEKISISTKIVTEEAVLFIENDRQGAKC